MEARGGNYNTALAKLVNDAQDEGGAQANDPNARALANAASGKGDIISNLRAAASDSSFDDRIRKVQNDAEAHGWTQEGRELVNGMRHQQSSQSQDARHLGGLSFSAPPSGGSYGGGIPSMGNDLDSLAALLGKYRGNNSYNSHAMGVGMDHNFKNSINDEDEEAEKTLQPAYDQQLTKGNLENALLREQLRAASSANAPQPSHSSHLSIPSQEPIPQGGPPQQMPARVAAPDPYKKIRDAALQAAMNYMGLQNPHLLRGPRR